METSAIISTIAAAISVSALLATISRAQSAKTQAKYAREQAQSAQQQADVAVEQLRLMEADRDAEVENTRVEQSRSVFLTPAARMRGGSYKGPNETSSSYPVRISNGSKQEISTVGVVLTVDVGDGTPRIFKIEEPGLNPGAKSEREFKVKSQPEFPYEQWQASIEATFTDARGQRWTINNDGKRTQLAG